MTKREMFTNIANKLSNDEEVVAFCNHEIKLLDSHKATSKKCFTAMQKANLEVKENIVEALTMADGNVTVSDLINSSDALRGLTNQKVSALLRQLVLDGKVAKTIEGKKAYFAIVE